MAFEGQEWSRRGPTLIAGLWTALSPFVPKRANKVCQPLRSQALRAVSKLQIWGHQHRAPLSPRRGLLGGVRLAGGRYQSL